MFTTTVDIAGDLRAVVAEEIPAVADRLAGSVRATAESAQGKLRRQVDTAGLGVGLNKAWQLNSYPQGKRTLRPAALVYSKSAVLHEAFAEGATILPRRSKYLVVALQKAIDLGFGYSTISRKGGAVPGGQKRKVSNLDAAAESLNADVVSVMPGRNSAARKPGKPRAEIRLLPSKSRSGALLAVLFAPGAKTGTPLFLLLRVTRLPRLLDLETVREEAETELRSNVETALGTVA